MTKQAQNTQSTCQAVKIGNLTFTEGLLITLENLHSRDEIGERKNQIAKAVFWLTRSNFSDDNLEEQKEIVACCQHLYDIIDEMEKGGDND